MGKSYTLAYTKDNKAYIEKKWPIISIKLPTVDLSLKESDIEDEDEDEEDEDEEEELSSSPLNKTTDEFLSELEDQQNKKASKKQREIEKLKVKVIEKKNKIDFKANFRYVRFEENAFISTEREGAFDDGQGNRLEDVTSSIEEFTPQQEIFDFRLDWNTNRKIGQAYIYTAGWFEAGSQSDLYRDVLQIFSPRKKGRGNIEINELYFINSWDNIDLTLGKRIYKTGNALLYSPVDRITPKDLYDPLDHKELGNWMLQLDTYPGMTSTFTYLLIPYLITNKSADTLILTDDQRALLPEKQFPETTVENFTHYIQYKDSLYGTDYFLGFLYGHSPYPVYAQEITSNGGALSTRTIEEYVKVINYFAGVSKNISKATVYSEMVYQSSEGGKDDDYLSYVFGGKYQFNSLADIFGLHKFYTVFEYAGEKVMKEQDASDFNNISLNPGESVRKIYIKSSKGNRGKEQSVTSRFGFDFTKDFTLAYSFSKNLVTDSLLQIYSAEWRPMDNWFVKLNYESFAFNFKTSESSSTSTQFGNFDSTATSDISRKFNRITLKLEYSF